ncbi:MAG: PAS domain S-box protein, partial [Leptolyngbya sp. SIO4C5]|nr:PAS domain S-box protein [Leptolyngbya sp. SIO4C5]
MLKKLHRTVLFVEVSAEQENSCAEYWLQASPIAYQILTEPDGDRALERCQQQRVDAVILRLAAHALSLEAISQLQQLGDRCPPIVVIDQGAGAVETAVQALKAGATDYLAADKVTPERLQRSLQMAIEAVAQQRAERWSQEQFYALVENMVDCCGIFSAIRDRSGQITDFRIDYLNRAAWEANQMPRSAQVGQNLCELLPAHRTSGLFAAYCQVVETGEPLIKDSLVYDDFFGQQRLVRAFDLRAAKLRDGFVASWRDITARKHLELNLSQTAASLQQEQSRLQQLIQQAPIGIGIGTASGEVKVINDAMLELHGYTRAEFEQNGMNWRDFTPPELMESTQQAMDQLRQEEAIVAEEKEILRRDGTRVPIWISAVRWLGHPDEHVAFAIDIRDRKQIETSLLQSEAYFRQLADSAPMMIWVTDATGYCTYLSQGWYAFTGQTEATGLGFGWLTAVHPEDRELAEKLFRDANKQNESFRLEYRLRHQDGEYRWTIDAASPRFSQEGEFQGYIGSVVDISDRKQSEVALKESEERFRTLADNISQFTWMANESGWIFWYNRRWFDYTGTTLAEMQGWGWQQVHHPDYVEEVTAKFRRHVESGEAWEDTFPLRGKDGQYRWFLSRAVPICDEQGRVLRWFGTNTDVTDLRQAEMDLQQTSERLKITLRSAPITLFNQDLDLRYTWIYNPTHRYATPEVMGQQDADLVSPQSAAYLTELKRRVIETGESLREEVEVVRGKQIAYYDLTVDPLRDENNQIIGITGAAVDISQKTQLAAAGQQAQVKLQQSEDRLRMAVEAARLGTWDWNLVTDELIWDAGCKAMFGLPADAEVNIEIYYHSLHPEDRDRMEQIVQWALNPAPEVRAAMLLEPGEKSIEELREAGFTVAHTVPHGEMLPG